MCFVKTDDPSWPHVLSELPNGAAVFVSDDDAADECWSLEIANNNNSNGGWERPSRPQTLSLSDLQARRHHGALPFGQSALCMALQKNLPLATIRLLCQSDPTILQQVDDQNGDSPLMYAIRYGNPTAVVRYLTEADNSILYHRNQQGKTCLHLAVEFACATVTDELRFRLVTKEEETLECTALENVNYLVQTAGLAMDMGDKPCDNTPLHLVVQDPGPGRLTVMRTILGALVETQQASGHATHGGSLLTQVVGYFLRRYRLHDKQTILHLACQASNFTPVLVQLILDLEDPTQLVMKNTSQQTPLHVLCHLNADTKKENGGDEDSLLFSVDEVHTSLTRMLQSIVAFKPLTKVLLQRDHSGDTPLETYLKNPFLQPKDPLVLSHLMFNNNNNNNNTTTTPSVLVLEATKDALLSENPNGLLLDFQCFLEDRDDVVDDKEWPDIDPTLCCLWLLLNQELKDKNDSTQPCRDALEAVNIFLRIIPEAKLRQSRYGANVRCVLKIIFHALFAATYRRDLTKTKNGMSIISKETKNGNNDDAATPQPQDDERWAHAIVEELQSKESRPLPLQRIKRGVLNCIYRDSNTVSKVLLLPSVPVRLVSLAFPTCTPGIEHPSHLFCPFYKPLSFYQYCARRSIVSCQLHNDAIAYLTPLVTPQVMERRLHLLIDLVGSNVALFGQERLNCLFQMKGRLDEFQREG